MSATISFRGRQRRHRRKGAMLVLVCFMLIIVLIMTAFSVDVAFMQLTRTQLRTATDAAARAGTEALSRTQSIDDARVAAIAAAAMNRVAGQPLLLEDSDVLFGNSSSDAAGVFSFVDGARPTNSVRVNGRRTDDSLSGSVPLFLGHIMGRSTFEPVVNSASVNLDRDICLVVDRSGSMNSVTSGSATPPGWRRCDPPHPALSRFGELTQAVQQFILALETTEQQEQLGLVSYSSANNNCGIARNDSDIEQELDLDYTLATSAMANLASNSIEGRTNITAGVRDAISVLTNPATSRPFAVRTMVVLTDGIHNTGPHPRTLCATAVANDITIHTITFSAEADQAGMRDVARLTSGQHFHAPNRARLEEIFREIALTLPVVMIE
ncbi:MAG: vWA domain-containing protein [Pirellulaceae bacterium]|nr:VWA domain-containing protein [Planctomycetales bacterium]